MKSGITVQTINYAPMKLEKGDFLEKSFCDLIRSKLPAYEEIWGEFIGHDGHGQMIKIALPKQIEIIRIRFSECNYTCLESLLCMLSISDNIDDIELSNPQSYLKAQNNLIAFQAHSGRIRDNLMKMIECFFVKKKEGIKDQKITKLLSKEDGKENGIVTKLIARLSDLYERRNNALHGKKLPFYLEDKLLATVELKGKDDNRSKWDSSMNWNDYQGKLTFISDFYKENVQEISMIYNDILSNLREPIKKLIDEYQIKLIQSESNLNPTQFESSGSVTIDFKFSRPLFKFSRPLMPETGISGYTSNLINDKKKNDSKNSKIK